MQISDESLKKIPNEPAARLLAKANVKLDVPLKAPASASVADVLRELAEQDARFDMMQLLAAALPPREAVWWACLAATDLVGSDDAAETPALRAAKAWVYNPDVENKEAARLAMDSADFDDDTVYCAMAAFYGDGTAGTGAMAEHPAPPGAVSGAVFAQNMLSMGVNGGEVDADAEYLIARALDIAGGGNGKVARPDTAQETGAL